MRLTAESGIPDSVITAYAIEPAPGTDLSDTETLRTLGETVAESVRLTGTEPSAKAETGSRTEGVLLLGKNRFYLVLAEDLRKEGEKVRFLPSVIRTGNEDEMRIQMKKETVTLPVSSGQGGSSGRGEKSGASKSAGNPARPERTLSEDSPVRGVLGAARPEYQPAGVLGESRKLPQTGQLWWPVPIFLSGALLLTAWNLLDGRRAALAAGKAAAGIENEVRRKEKEGEEQEERMEIPAYWANPEMPMPAVEIEGERFIGILYIPALELELPVMETWSYQGLRTAPCRYCGSAYLDNMVICGHNYPSHLGRLTELRCGAEISFSDMDGNHFRYVICGMEVMTADSADIIREASGGDLTLFTCTPGGKTRYAVFCRRLRMVE